MYRLACFGIRISAWAEPSPLPPLRHQIARSFSACRAALLSLRDCYSLLPQASTKYAVTAPAMTPINA
jgi:hypothetical protein